MQIARALVVMPLVVLLMIASGPALAQSQLPHETLSEVRDEISSTTPYPATLAPLISLPDAPAPQRVKGNVSVIDKQFIAVMATLGGAESLRFTTHKLVLDHEFAAGAPWVTSVPQNHRLVARYAAIYAAELLVAYELKKPHSWLPGDRVIRKLWWLYPAAMAPIHIKNGVRSIRTQAPPCPVAECQAQ